MSRNLESVWNEMYGELASYREANGHCNVPKKYNHNPKLGEWASMQRARWDRLPLERKQRLLAIGFERNAHDAIWNKMYAALAEYQKLNGHCEVPRTYRANPALGRWVHQQRQLWDDLSQERQERLSLIKFSISVRQPWGSMYSMLLDYQKQHGNCNVPARYKNRPELGIWVVTQRHNWEKLSTDRRELLLTIGFEPDPKESQWNAKYAVLVEFKKTTGHCQVSIYDPVTRPLGMWVIWQRKTWEKLSPLRQQLLLDLGVKQNPRDVIWNDMIKALIEYKAQHRHCNVPGVYEANPSLGTWVKKQRVRHRKGLVLPERVDQLNSLGFVWELRPPVIAKKTQ